MKFGCVVLEKSESIATIYLNRPEVYNAFNEQILRELHIVFDHLSEDDEVAAVIITGNGPAFAGGADLTKVFDLDSDLAYKGARNGQELMDKIERLHCPVIAAINGIAMGGGAELAWACDLRIASEKAIFAQPEVRFGFNLGWGGTQRLPFIVGRTRAMEMMLLSENVSAQKALEWGLVNKVVAPEELMNEAQAMAQKIARFSRRGIVSTKRAAVDGYQTCGRSMLLEAELWGSCFRDEEPKTRIKTFLERLGKKNLS